MLKRLLEIEDRKKEKNIRPTVNISEENGPVSEEEQEVEESEERQEEAETPEERTMIDERRGDEDTRVNATSTEEETTIGHDARETDGRKMQRLVEDGGATNSKKRACEEGLDQGKVSTLEVRKEDSRPQLEPASVPTETKAKVDRVVVHQRGAISEEKTCQRRVVEGAAAIIVNVEEGEGPEMKRPGSFEEEKEEPQEEKEEPQEEPQEEEEAAEDQGIVGGTEAIPEQRVSEILIGKKVSATIEGKDEEELKK